MTTINRKQLAAALKIVAPAVQRGGNAPALGGVRIVGDFDGRLTLTATNLDLTIEHRISTQENLDVDLLVPAPALTRMVSSMSGETVTLEPDDTSVEIRSGRTKATLGTLSVNEWPKLGAIDAEPHELTPEQVDMVRRVVHAASSNTGRPSLCGVHLDGTTARATDSFRLATVPLDLGDDWAPITIPTAALTAVLNHADDLAVQADSNAVRLTAGDTTWTTRLVDQHDGYPAFDRLIRDESKHTLVVNRTALIDAIGRVMTVESEASAVRLSIVDGELAVTSRGLDGDNVTDVVEIAADSGGPIPDFASNGHYLAQLLGAATGDSVEFEIEDSLKPAMVHDGEWTGLIMPVRVG